MQNIDAVNLGHADHLAVPEDAGILSQFFIKDFAFGMRELFGVVQNGVRKVGREDDGGDADGSGQGAASGFIYADNVGVPGGTEEVFMVEAGHGVEFQRDHQKSK